MLVIPPPFNALLVGGGGGGGGYIIEGRSGGHLALSAVGKPAGCTSKFVTEKLSLDGGANGVAE